MHKLMAGKASILALTIALAVASFLLGKSLTSVSAVAVDKIAWCHCEPNGGCQTLNLPGAALQNAGHMDASGNPLHAGDHAGACATEPVDLCTNIDGPQQSIPDGYYHTEEGECLPKTLVCTDEQALNFDDDFNSSTEISDDSVCEYEGDICPNLEGPQSSLPEGYHFETINDVRQCVKDPEPTPTTNDVCYNLDGVQTSVPDGYHQDQPGGACNTFSNPGPGEPPAATGQVLGATTMAKAGGFAETFWLAIMGLGGALTTLGFKKLLRQA